MESAAGCCGRQPHLLCYIQQPMSVYKMGTYRANSVSKGGLHLDSASQTRGLFLRGSFGDPEVGLEHVGPFQLGIFCDFCCCFFFFMK